MHYSILLTPPPHHTTHAFSGATVWEMQPKFPGHYNLASTENAPELRYRTTASNEIVTR